MVGPDLTHVGSKRDADWLMRHFKDPQFCLAGVNYAEGTSSGQGIEGAHRLYAELEVNQ